MKLNVDTTKVWHPVEECTDELIELLAEVQQRSYNFDVELQEVQDIRFSLDEHPEDDVVGFNELYANVQAHHSRVTTIFIKILREKAEWQRFAKRAKTLHRKAFNRLLNLRDDIKELRNKELQAAKIGEEIPEIISLQEFLEGVVDDLESLADIVSAKKEELERADTNLSRQQKAVDTLIGLNYTVRARRPQE